MRLFALISLAALLLAFGAARGAAQKETKPALAEESSQQIAQQSAQQTAQPQTVAPAPDKSKIVYVSDFELDAVNADGKLEKSVPAIPPSTAPQLDPKREQGPVEQAGRLVDFMSTTLVKELEKAGYTAHRLRPGGASRERPRTLARWRAGAGHPWARARTRTDCRPARI